LVILVILGEDYKIWSSSLCSYINWNREVNYFVTIFKHGLYFRNTRSAPPLISSASPTFYRSARRGQHLTSSPTNNMQNYLITYCLLFIVYSISHIDVKILSVLTH
jgi:hypothetical protein